MFEVIMKNNPTASKRRLYGKLIDSADAVSGKNITTTGVKAKLTKADGTNFTTAADIVLTDPTNKPGRFYVELAATGEADVLGVIDGEVPAGTGYLAASLHGEIVAYDPDADGASVTDIAAGVRTELAAELGDIVALNTRVPSDPADESMVEAAVTAVLNAVNALNDIDAVGVRAAVGLAAADLDTQLGALPDAAAIVEAILDADLETNGATTVKVRLALQLAAALPAGVIAGILAGAGAQTVTLKSASGQPFLSYATDELGNRASVTITPIT